MHLCADAGVSPSPSIGLHVLQVAPSRSISIEAAMHGLFHTQFGMLYPSPGRGWSSMALQLFHKGCCVSAGDKVKITPSSTL